jgi:tRNA N6-adenosine threonylcarbamoyltransferase
MARNNHKLVMGIETSCDETAVAIVGSDRTIHANQILSQFEDHSPYGGVVPEIAARAHSDHLDHLIRAALDEAGCGLDELDAIAVTAGPGLIGGVMVGVMAAKALSFATGKPMIAINHLEGHALSPRLMEKVQTPYLLLLISGGHCQLLEVRGLGQYRRLGTTIDDAVGEAFDKTAKLLGLGVPGGPAVEIAAKRGDARRFSLPRPLLGRDGCDFSFSGLKTALRRELDRLVEKAGTLDDRDINDLCAAMQAAISDCLVDRSANAMMIFRDNHQETERPAFVVAGGVAANQTIGAALKILAGQNAFEFIAPPPWLCTDNAAMIAWAGIERLAIGDKSPLDFRARSRWPLDEAAVPRVGSGKKGAKV